MRAVKVCFVEATLSYLNKKPFTTNCFSGERLIGIIILIRLESH